MKVSELVERVPNANFFYGSVTQEEADSYQGEKYLLPDTDKLFLCTLEEVEVLAAKRLKVTGMIFE